MCRKVEENAFSRFPSLGLCLDGPTKTRSVGNGDYHVWIGEKKVRHSAPGEMLINSAGTHCGYRRVDTRRRGL